MFIHDAILEQVTCGDTQISADQLHSTMKKLTEDNQVTGLHTQFCVSIINPRRTCTARVTVLAVSVRVCVSVCLLPL